MRFRSDPLITRAILPFGLPPIDNHIAGGLDMYGLHEVRPDARDKEADRVVRQFVGAICARARCSTVWLHAGYWSPNRLGIVGFDGAGMVLHAVSDDQALDIAAAGAASGRFGVIVIELESVTREQADRLDTIGRRQTGMVFVIRRRRDGRNITSAPVAYDTRWAVGPGEALHPDEPEPQRVRWRIRHLNRDRRTTLDITVFAASRYGQMSPVPRV